MDERRPTAEAVIVKDGVIVDAGGIDDLVQAFPGAAFDERYLRRVLLPAFVDARERPSEFALIEVACGDDVSAGDIAAIERAAGGRPPVRLVVEARGAMSADDALSIVAQGAALILSDDPPANDCAAPDGAPPMLSGRIALAAASGETSLLKAAGARFDATLLNRLSPQEALEAITIDAAYALGREAGQGSIAAGKRARVAVLGRNPLATPAEGWGAISVEVVELSAVVIE